MLSIVFLVFLAGVQSQSNTNIYGYNYDSNANSNGLSLVQNPNYQFLNDQLANEYAQTYLQEQRNYDQSSGTANNNGFVTSSSSVPAVGYYTGPPLSNTQQNQINYQQILQRNPSSNTNTGSSNIYGYAYNQGSTSNTYNNQPLYSAPSTATAQPYVYPFGQYAQSTSTQNTVLRDQSTSSSSINRNGNYQTGQTYTLFDSPNSAVGYQSASDLKTTRLRDQGQPATLNLRGAGPLPGPTISNTGTTTNNQVFRDSTVNNNGYYSTSTASSFNNGNRASRFFDVAGNNTEMYYPYRTSTNFNTQQQSNNGVQFDQSRTNNFANSGGCALQDPYWCAEYVQVYLSAKQQYENTPLQQACQTLVQSLTQSYNGCCQTVRAAGCST